MVHPEIDPGSTLAARLQVLRKPNFVAYMGAYGVPEEQVGWGKTGTCVFVCVFGVFLCVYCVYGIVAYIEHWS